MGALPPAGGLRAPAVLLSTRRPRQGETVVVLVAVPRAPPGPRRAARRALAALGVPPVLVSLAGRPVPVFLRPPDPGAGAGGAGGAGGGGAAGGGGGHEVWRALVPTTPLTAPGPRALCVALPWDPLGPRVRAELQVLERAFPCERVELPAGKPPLNLGAGPGGGSAEARSLARWRRARTRARLWAPSQPFRAPAAGPVTTGYGVRRAFGPAGAAPLAGYFHRGVDFGCCPGSPAVAPAAGRVSLVGREDAGFPSAGNCVGLDHGQGVQSLLLHLEAACVAEGQPVAAGQVVGRVGSSGASTGPHLHWGLFVAGEAVDPAPWLAGTPRSSPWGT